jgi:hypothetical protein
MKATGTKKSIEVTLELTEYEAQCLLAITGKIAGKEWYTKGVDTPRHILSTKLRNALTDAGIQLNPNIEVTRYDGDCGIRVNDRTQGG